MTAAYLCDQTIWSEISQKTTKRIQTATTTHTATHTGTHTSRDGGCCSTAVRTGGGQHTGTDTDRWYV